MHRTVASSSSSSSSYYSSSSSSCISASSFFFTSSSSSSSSSSLLLGVAGFLASVLVQSAAYGQYFAFAPGIHKTATQLCSSDSDCDGISDMVCWWLYDGCNHGHCMCDPRTHVTHSSGRCRRVRRLNEACERLNDSCSEASECINGTCQCPYPGSVRDSLQQQQYPVCILPNYRALGEACNPSTDTCFHESAYGLADREVECTGKGVCRCKEGYKQDGRTCRRLHIWERGCRKDYDCEGGAVCVDEECACPNGYKSAAGNTKCAKRGAMLELPLRARCDEINERGYCSKGLVCHRCKDNEAPHICARYLPGFETENSQIHSHVISLVPFTSVHLLVTFSVCLYMFVVVR